MDSWRSSTKKQYRTYQEKWFTFCTDKGVSPIQVDINRTVNFLQSLSEDGLQYSAVNTARSAVSSMLQVITGQDIGSHHLITRFMRGLFQQKPNLPRYTQTWDPDTVLNYLKTLSPVKTLGLKHLSLKTVTLLAILSGQRLDTIQKLKRSDIQLTKNSVHISISSVIKQSRPTKHQEPIKTKAYAPDRRLCIVTVLNEYLRRTETLRGENTDNLFVLHRKPHTVASKDTIARWIKNTMTLAGVDTKRFGPHSVRSASTSAARQSGLPLDKILKAAGWSRESTFRKYYEKPMDRSGEFANSVLNRHRNKK